MPSVNLNANSNPKSDYLNESRSKFETNGEMQEFQNFEEFSSESSRFEAISDESDGNIIRN